MRMTTLKNALLPLAALAALPAFAATNLVQNGDFEQSSGVGELAKTTTIATTSAWTVGATTDGSADPFVFIVDKDADRQDQSLHFGFPSVFTPGANKNIHVWGPQNVFGSPNPPPPPGVGFNNGFTGSSNGGFFFGADAAYANAPISQTVSGLTAGKTYTLSFEYASAQFTDATGAYFSGWDVSLDGNNVASVSNSVRSQGFAAWQTKSVTFSASGTSTLLNFLATGGPSGLPPFALLDGVSITEVVVPPPPVPEPATLALMLAGGGLVVMAVRRQRRRA